MTDGLYARPYMVMIQYILIYFNRNKEVFDYFLGGAPAAVHAISIAVTMSGKLS